MKQIINGVLTKTRNTLGRIRTPNQSLKREHEDGSRKLKLGQAMKSRHMKTRVCHNSDVTQETSDEDAEMDPSSIKQPETLKISNETIRSELYVLAQRDPGSSEPDSIPCPLFFSLISSLGHLSLMVVTDRPGKLEPIFCQLHSLFARRNS
jgi:hypothetical protein